VILGHIAGIPVEESVLQLAPAGAAMATVVAIVGRSSLNRLRRRVARLFRSPVAVHPDGKCLTATSEIDGQRHLRA